MNKRDQILSVFKPNAWLDKGTIAKASGVDPGMAGYYLKQLVDDKALIAIGTTGDRKWALPGTAGGEAPPQSAKPTRKGATKKRGHKKGGKRTKSGKAAASARTPQPATACNVAKFIPAMTTDKRMVIIGGTEPLIFSPEQTQSIADLVFDNFEACA